MKTLQPSLVSSSVLPLTWPIDHPSISVNQLVVIKRDLSLHYPPLPPSLPPSPLPQSCDICAENKTYFWSLQSMITPVLWLLFLWLLLLLLPSWDCRSRIASWKAVQEFCCACWAARCIQIPSVTFHADRETDILILLLALASSTSVSSKYNLQYCLCAFHRVHCGGRLSHSYLQLKAVIISSNHTMDHTTILVILPYHTTITSSYHTLPSNYYHYITKPQFLPSSLSSTCAQN